MNSGAWGTGRAQRGPPALLHQSGGGPRGAELPADDDKPDAIRDWGRGPEQACEVGVKGEA